MKRSIKLEVLERNRKKLPSRMSYIRACEFMGYDPWTNPNYSQEKRVAILGRPGEAR